MRGAAFDYSDFRINLSIMDKLRAMRTFVAIADSGSLTAAARVLGGSLPAVVRSLAALEEELGARLFNRTTRRIALTDSGRRYLERCRELQALLEEAEAELHVEQTEPRGKLTLTAPVLFGERHVASGIHAYVQRYPKVSVELHLLDRLANLVEEGVDVAVRIGTLQDSSLVARHVASMRRVTVASPSYLTEHGSPEHPKDLLRHNCVRVLRPGADGWTFVERGKPFVVPVQGNFTVNQLAVAAQACGAGLGVGSFFAYQVAPLIAKGSLRVILASYETAPSPIHIVYPQARLLPVRTRLLILHLQQHIGKEQRTWQLSKSVSRAPSRR
jgi:DNA-binding transcriptional LysR family regulator